MKSDKSTRRLQLIGGLLQVGAVNCPCCELRMYMQGAEQLKAFTSAYAKENGGRSPSKAERDMRTATVDHIIPQASGGTDRLENLFIICRKCNGEKDALSMVEWMQLRKNSGRSFKMVVQGYLLALHVKAARSYGREP